MVESERFKDGKANKRPPRKTTRNDPQSKISPEKGGYLYLPTTKKPPCKRHRAQPATPDLRDCGAGKRPSRRGHKKGSAWGEEEGQKKKTFILWQIVGSGNAAFQPSFVYRAHNTEQKECGRKKTRGSRGGCPQTKTGKPGVGSSFSCSGSNSTLQCDINNGKMECFINRYARSLNGEGARAEPNLSIPFRPYSFFFRRVFRTRKCPREKRRSYTALLCSIYKNYYFLYNELSAQLLLFATQLRDGIISASARLRDRLVVLREGRHSALLGLDAHQRLGPDEGQPLQLLRLLLLDLDERERLGCGGGGRWRRSVRR